MIETGVKSHVLIFLSKHFLRGCVYCIHNLWNHGNLGLGMPLKNPEHNFWLMLTGHYFNNTYSSQTFLGQMQLSWCSILHTLASVDTETRVGVGPAQWVVSQASNWLEEPNKGFSIIKVSMGLYFINIEQLHGLCCDGTMAVLQLHCRGVRRRGPRTTNLFNFTIYHLHFSRPDM